MNINPVAAGLAGAAASQQQAQATGDAARAQTDSSSQARQAATDLKAEMAAGIGQTDGEDHATSDRDADGRQVWHGRETEAQKEERQAAEDAARGRDATGAKGNTLDLTA